MNDERKVIPFPSPGDAERRAPGTVDDQTEGMEQLPIPGVAGDDFGPPFPWDARHVKAWLRANDPVRDALVVREGENVREYPDSLRPDAAHMINARRRTCSNPFCRKGVGDCVHLLEDDFRFGRFKGKPWAPPARMLKVGGKRGGKPYDGVERVLERPNPTVDGVKAATLERRARRLIKPRGIAIATRLANWLRMEVESAYVREFGPRKSRVGRPVRDGVDIAVAAALRIFGQHSYDDLAHEIPSWQAQGLLRTAFDPERVVEEMCRETLTEEDRRKGHVLIGPLIDKMTTNMHGMFRDVARVYVMDGLVFSTAGSDNARTNRLSVSGVLGPVQVELHAIYEIRWGLLVGYRVTWHQRGVGSGESPQFPHLISMTKEVFDIELVLADRAYSAEYNFWLAMQHGFQLKAPIVEPKWDPKTKRWLREDVAARFLTELGQKNPGLDLSIVYPFRNRVEGWNGVIRGATGSALISRPDRSKYPATAAEWKKENPDSHYAGLPEDPALRDAVIVANQQVGAAVENEFRCRRFVMALRAMVKAEQWYGQTFDAFAAKRKFDPRIEDEAYSIYRLPGVRAA